MKRDLCLKWIKALRSGIYQQGRGRLRLHLRGEGFRYCCLGVLCDLYDPSKWTGFRDNCFDGVEEVLGERHLAQLGLAWREAQILMEMNDRDRKDFGQIADWIEQHLLPNCTD